MSFDVWRSVLLQIDPERSSEVCDRSFVDKIAVEPPFRVDEETNAELIAEILLLLVSLDFFIPGCGTGAANVFDINLRCP